MVYSLRFVSTKIDFDISKFIEIVKEPKIFNLPWDFLKDGHHWLRDIYNNEYQSVKRTRALLSEEQWDRYGRWGDFEDHQECVLFRKQGYLLRKVLSSQKRPDLFKKVKFYGQIKKLKKNKS